MDRSVVVFSALIVVAFVALMQVSHPPTGEVAAYRESTYRDLGNVTLVEGILKNVRLE